MCAGLRAVPGPTVSTTYPASSLKPKCHRVKQWLTASPFPEAGEADSLGLMELEWACPQRALTASTSTLGYATPEGLLWPLTAQDAEGAAGR